MVRVPDRDICQESVLGRSSGSWPLQWLMSFRDTIWSNISAGPEWKQCHTSMHEFMWWNSPPCSVYIGGKFCAYDKALLLHKNIKLIINCTANLPTQFHGEDNIECTRFVISDMVDMNAYYVKDKFDQLFSQIKGYIRAGFSVLVHCQGGAHRAGATSLGIIFYLNFKWVSIGHLMNVTGI